MARQWSDPPPATNSHAVLRSREISSAVPLLPPGMTCRVVGHRWVSRTGGSETAIAFRRCLRCRCLEV